MKTLRARICTNVALLVAGSLLMGAGAAAGLMTLHRDMDVATRGYRQLRQVYEVGLHVAAARDDFESRDQEKAMASLQTAIVRLRNPSDDAGPAAPLSWLEESRREKCAAILEQAARELRLSHVALSQAWLNRMMSELAGISTEVRQAIGRRETSFERARQMTLWLVSGICVVIVLGAAIVGIRLYRSILRPLDRIGGGVLRFAGGNFDLRLAAEGDREFAELARSFNRMADELSALYRDLETKVQTKSRQLVQSERLASVGYLAAGVAHEINNPLGIIAGYGERSLDRLSKGLDASTAVYLDRAVRIICDETFRCKQITDRLLMLARPGEDARQIVVVPDLVREVIASVGGLKRFSDRKIMLDVEERAELTVHANEGELRQVVLNLLVNALEAAAAATGEVGIAIRRDGEHVKLSVVDNGQGMEPATLSRVFEPFFTHKRGQRPGTGLGLSVAHAIVSECGGRIEAHSNGIGMGSQFIVRLPASAKESCHANN